MKKYVSPSTMGLTSRCHITSTLRTSCCFAESTVSRLLLYLNDNGNLSDNSKQMRQFQNYKYLVCLKSGNAKNGDRLFTSKLPTNNTSKNQTRSARVYTILFLRFWIYVQIQRNLRRNPKCGFENFFLAHLSHLVFLVVCSIHKRNSLLYNAYRMVYFF